MTPLAWFVLGLVLGAFLVLIGSSVALGVAVAKRVRRDRERDAAIRASHPGCAGPSCWCHRMRERGGRVTVGER